MEAKKTITVQPAHTHCYVVGARGTIGSAICAYLPMRSQFVITKFEIEDYIKASKAHANPFRKEAIVVLAFAVVHNRSQGVVMLADDDYSDQAEMYKQYISWCEQAGVRRVVLVSSSAVYGIITSSGLEYNAYSRHRRCVEQLLIRSGLDYAIVRPSCVLVPNEKKRFSALKNGVGYILTAPRDQVSLERNFFRGFSYIDDIPPLVYQAARRPHCPTTDVPVISMCNIEHVLKTIYRRNVRRWHNACCHPLFFSCIPSVLARLSISRGLDPDQLTDEHAQVLYPMLSESVAYGKDGLDGVVSGVLV